MTSPNKTLVDFYILEEKSQSSIGLFCCRLTEKVLKLGNTVYIRTNDESETKHLDDLMWTYNKHSFLPHATQSEKLNAPVIIGHEDTLNPADLLINLALTSPENINGYTRIAEILNGDDKIKASGRIRYTDYKDSGCTVNHHKIESK